MINLMKYPGGKGKTYQHIINTMPPHQVYIETHLGGGAVMRNKLPAHRNIGIEKDRAVFASWADTKHDFSLELICGDAETFLSSYSFAGNELVYADPPYHPDTRCRRRVYRHDYDISDHEKLLKILKNLPCMVIVSGYQNPLYQDALAGWQTKTFSAKSHTSVREEMLWFNFAPPKQLHDVRYLGSDFRQRESTKRRVERIQQKMREMDAVERAAITQWLNETYPLA